jgi:hypothetical protein
VGKCGVAAFINCDANLYYYQLFVTMRHKERLFLFTFLFLLFFINNTSYNNSQIRMFELEQALKGQHSRLHFAALAVIARKASAVPIVVVTDAAATTVPSSFVSKSFH